MTAAASTVLGLKQLNVCYLVILLSGVLSGRELWSEWREPCSCE
jgi:hypothetical protein